MRPWLRRALGVLLLGVSSYFGGVGATSVFPTTVETANYSAQLRLSLLPRLESTIHSPTSFGDIDLKFRSVLPTAGIDATIQVKESITALFDDRSGLSIDALQPQPSEVTDAISTAAQQVGLRFAGGVVFVTIVGLGLLAYGRRRPLTKGHLALGGVTAMAVMALTGAGIGTTYQADQLTTFRTTGLIGTVQQNKGLLDEVENRARQATPYVRNLLALSEALRAKFTPENLDEAVAARLLLVSDIHGANQYSLMRQIVVDEQVDAVIDTGDLLNFGSVAEAQAAGLFDAIEALGVPYLFVRGNHDAGSLTDQSLLQRMSLISNVILLEPVAGEYTAVGVNGVVVAGFNDPRYFGDDNKNNSAEQAPAADAFNQAFAVRAAPDLVVSHEPGAAEKVSQAVVRVHGHLHVRKLEGNTIGVGSFTGGGTVSHFVESAASAQEEEGEADGQPYAFDVAVYGQTCGLTSLTRYTYRGLVQGRPAYDDVAVISGRTIAGEPPADRSCLPTDGLTRQTVTAPDPEALITSTTPLFTDTATATAPSTATATGTATGTASETPPGTAGAGTP